MAARKLCRFFASIVSVAVLSLMVAASYMQFTIPDKFSIPEGESFSFHQYNNLSLSYSGVVAANDFLGAYSNAGSAFNVTIRLFGVVPVKTVAVSVLPADYVVPLGEPFGIKIFTEGVMVVGTADVPTDSGPVNPAKEAGIKVGDVILTVGGAAVNSNEAVANAIVSSNGTSIPVVISRKGEKQMVELRPVMSKSDGKLRGGLWVRDSSAGIGTITFVNPVSGVFGGLGHAVCDVDTGEVLPLLSGESVDVDITGVTKGQAGSPGELKGVFVGTQASGKLYSNGPTGLYGVLNRRVDGANAVQVAMKQEVKEGPATILTTISGGKPREYSINIEKINYIDSNPSKNFVIRITDEELLNQTGGIVQGMSGSPILQNGKLVGAVTHVFVNDPTKGYAIFAESMLENADNLVMEQKKAS